MVKLIVNQLLSNFTFFRIYCADNLNVMSDKKKKTGLGLAIAKNIFELHDATVEVNSGEGGTEFLITFHKKVEGENEKNEEKSMETKIY